MKIEENFSLREYNTFDIDVRCKYFISSQDEQDIIGFVREYDLKPSEILLLGGGSNFLFTDDFDGTVIYPVMQGIEIVEKSDEYVRVKVGAGVIWDDFVKWAVEHDYSGVENLSLIPGHVGASPVQNIGAYGMEAAETIHEVEAVDIKKGEKVVIKAADCRFAYRDSIFKNEWKNSFIVTYVTFQLKLKHEYKLNYGSIKEELEHFGGEVNLKSIRKAVINIRNSKLPDVKVLPNAGSFFKNPIVRKETAEQLRLKYPAIPVYPLDDEQVKLAAGWMIEQSGWKGKSIGCAGVHDKQALVLVNRGNATGVEIAHLANEIKKSVFMQFGILIEPEVNII